MDIFFIIFLIWNIAVMLAYGTDKLFARKKHRRISENTLILLSLLFGGTGAMFGMVLFNHKTSKNKFRYLVPLTVVLNWTLIIGAITFINR